MSENPIFRELAAAPAPPATAVAELEPVTEAPVVVMMTEDEARDRVDQINNHSNRIGELLLELHDRQGWRASGYNSWDECSASAFKYSRSRLYQLIDAARVEKNVSNMLDIGESLPARAVDQLKHLEPEQQREVVQKAKDAAPDGKVTAKAVEEAVTPKKQVLEAHEVTREVPSWESSGVAQKEPVIEDDQEVPTITRQEEASQETTRLARTGPWKREK
jgi:hypothetical protein